MSLDLESVDDGIMVLAAAQLMKLGLEFSVGKNDELGYVLVSEDPEFEVWLTELTAWARVNDRALWPGKIAAWAAAVAEKLGIEKPE